MSSEEVRKAMIASVERDRARLERRAALPPRRVRRTTGPSIVYSLRLDRAEVAELEELAAELDIKPTVLARNLLRAGLAARNAAALGDAVDRLEQAVHEVRALVR